MRTKAAKQLNQYVRNSSIIDRSKILFNYYYYYFPFRYLICGQIADDDRPFSMISYEPKGIPTSAGYVWGEFLALSVRYQYKNIQLRK